MKARSQQEDRDQRKQDREGHVVGEDREREDRRRSEKEKEDHERQNRDRVRHRRSRSRGRRSLSRERRMSGTHDHRRSIERLDYS